MDVKTARNVAVVLAIAAVVYLAPGSGRVASAFQALIGVGFGVAVGLLGARAYRERRVAIHSLGDRHRAILYGGLALAAFAWIARPRMWQTTTGEIVWFALVALVVYALIDVFRRARAY